MASSFDRCLVMGFDLQFLIVAGVISNLVGWLLLRSAVRARRVVLPGNHRMAILQYATAIRSSCLGLTGILAVLAVIAVTPPLYEAIRPGDALPLPVRTACIVLLLAALVVLIEALSRRVVLTGEAIASFGILSRCAMRWDEVEAVRFNRYLRTLVFESVEGRRLTINPSLSGLDFLETLAVSKLSAGQCAKAFRALHRYRGGPIG